MKFSNIISLCVLLMTILAACGGDGDDDRTDTISPSTATPAAAAATNTPTQRPPTDGTPTPTPTSAATNTPPPTNTAAPTATPEPAGFYVRDFGFGQRQDSIDVRWGIVIENTDDVHALRDSEYQIAFLDEDDFAVDTTSGVLTLILPGQRLGVAGEVLVSEGTRVSSMQVQLRAGSSHVSSQQPFVVEQATFYGGLRYSQVRGIVRNPSAATVTDLQIFTIAYDETGQIIGGGHSFLDVVPASGRAVGGHSIVTGSSVAAVEMFATITMLSREITVDPETELQLTKFGFGIEPDQSDLGWAALVINPTPDVAAASSRFQVSFYDEDGRPVDNQGGWIDHMLFPGSTGAIGSRLFSVPAGMVPTVMEIALAPVWISDTGEFEQFIVEGLAYEEQAIVEQVQYPRVVTAIIRNPYDTDIGNLHAVAVLYDDEGMIIGGGEWYLDFLPAQGEASIAVEVAASGTPATFELYVNSPTSTFG